MFLSRPPKGTVVSSQAEGLMVLICFYLALPRALWYRCPHNKAPRWWVFISPSQGHCGIADGDAGAIGGEFLSRPPKGTVVSVVPNLLK